LKQAINSENCRKPSKTVENRRQPSTTVSSFGQAENPQNVCNILNATFENPYSRGTVTDIQAWRTILWQKFKLRSIHVCLATGGKWVIHTPHRHSSKLATPILSPTKNPLTFPQSTATGCNMVSPGAYYVNYRGLSKGLQDSPVIKNGFLVLLMI